MKIADLVERINAAVAELSGRVIVSDTAMGHLNALYTMVWPEAFYDGRTDSVQKYARELWSHIEALNDELKFRRGHTKSG